ncbi:MAG: polysaccharide biosynthesis protein, partial [Clostridiales bacterium]|nr:polysaccharide biosynthesis protein [Clostridiales bacterium]
ACLLDAVFVGGTRFAYQYVRAYRYPGYFTLPGVKRRMLGSENSSRVLLVGGGDAGATVINEIRHQPDDRRRIVAIIDDNYEKHSKRISGIRIVGDRYMIPDAVKRYAIDEIIIAIPSAPRKTIAEILSICRETKCQVKVMPSLIDLISEKVSVKYLRDVEIEDLLGREPV